MKFMSKQASLEQTALYDPASAILLAQRLLETNAAWSTLAIAHGCLREQLPAIHAIGRLVDLCKISDSKSLERLLTILQSANKELQTKADLAWMERLLLLILTTHFDDKQARRKLEQLASWQNHSDHKADQPLYKSTQKIVILAGGCDQAIEPALAQFKRILQQACQGFSFDLISGGTSAGISGVAGAIASESNGQIQAFGYLPEHLPHDLKADTAHYPHLIHTPGKSDFSIHDPLQAWTDLIASGIKASEVTLLCYAPGPIAKAECALALILGARVGVVTNVQLPRERHFDATAWKDVAIKLLKLLPMDAMEIPTFLFQ